jgi:hypothetical protein
MSTSPQISASDKYLHRMHDEGRWNKRRGRHAGFSPGPVLPELPSATECGEDSASEATNLWSTGSVLSEAREFAVMVGRNGWNVEELRADIGISPEELVELEKWCEAEPTLAWHIRTLVHYRQRVLAAFNVLVENEGVL